MTDINSRIAKLEELAREATPGPWFWKYCDSRKTYPQCLETADNYTVLDAVEYAGNSWIESDNDGDLPYIAAANPSQIIEIINALRAEQRQSKAYVDELDRVWDALGMEGDEQEYYEAAAAMHDRALKAETKLTEAQASSRMWMNLKLKAEAALQMSNELVFSQLEGLTYASIARQELVVRADIAEARLKAVTDAANNLLNNSINHYMNAEDMYCLEMAMESQVMPAEQTTAPATPAHILYKDGDADAPDCVKDDNGDIVLDKCRVCQRCEVELDEPCTPKDAT